MEILYFLIAVLVLALMIFVHELGHYTAGRLLGFKILDFSIGFGPAIFKIRKNDIDYALRAIPLGGACRFYGEEDDPQDAVSFNAQKPWKRLIVIFAGPFMNFVLAYVLAVVMLLCFGEREAVKYPNGDYAIVINAVGKDSPAERSGLAAEDIILSVGGVDITGEPHEYKEKTKAVSEAITAAASDGVSVSVDRDGVELTIFVSDIYNASEGRNFLGITMSPGEVFVRKNLGQALTGGFGFVITIVKTTFSALRCAHHEDGFYGILLSAADNRPHLNEPRHHEPAAGASHGRRSSAFRLHRTDFRQARSAFCSERSEHDRHSTAADAYGFCDRKRYKRHNQRHFQLRWIWRPKDSRSVTWQ